MADWNPEAYGRFRDLRLRPALDLLAQVGPLPDGPVIDLGCGDGGVGPALAARFGAVEGVDASPAMLARARAGGAYARLTEGDIAEWAPDAPPALIYSNAVLHWLGDHEVLFPRLAACLAPGGVLAVQMPAQHDAPSHALLREIAEGMFPGRFALRAAPVHAMETYHHWLQPFGEPVLWETIYLQRQPPEAEGHPVRAFTRTTAMRPFLDRMTWDEEAAYLAAYDEGLARAYPLLPDGGTLFPFSRRFLTLRT
ncbi:MAG: methyltransferase domain-containing protein [Gemmobacter sp.]